jgi:hypothetical protein
MCRCVERTNKNRRKEITIYGVLNDYDLSSWKKDLQGDYTRTSQQRTGTPPYMAQELLTCATTTHLYRHDIESLFYIMLLVCARYTITADGLRERAMKQLPYEEWFNQPKYVTLGDVKGAFFTKKRDIHISTAFEEFRPWLADLQLSFGDGMISKDAHRIRKGRPGASVAAFNDETLGNFVDYAAFTKQIPMLEGELEGLLIRYEPT